MLHHFYDKKALAERKSLSISWKWSHWLSCLLLKAHFIARSSWPKLLSIDGMTAFYGCRHNTSLLIRASIYFYHLGICGLEPLLIMLLIIAHCYLVLIHLFAICTYLFILDQGCPEPLGASLAGVAHLCGLHQASHGPHVAQTLLPAALYACDPLSHCCTAPLQLQCAGKWSWFPTPPAATCAPWNKGGGSQMGAWGCNF